MKAMFEYDPAKRMTVRWECRSCKGWALLGPRPRVFASACPRPPPRSPAQAPQPPPINHQSHRCQAKDALLHPYFDDLDKVLVDGMEEETVSAQLAESLATLATQRGVATEAA